MAPIASRKPQLGRRVFPPRVDVAGEWGNDTEAFGRVVQTEADDQWQSQAQSPLAAD
jgi:hypothetical protein